MGIVELIPLVGPLWNLYQAIFAEPQWWNLLISAGWTLGVMWTVAKTLGPRIVALTDTDYDDRLLDKLTTVLGILFKIVVALGTLDPKRGAKMKKVAEAQGLLEKKLQMVG